METVCALVLLGLVVIFVVNIFPSSVLASKSGNQYIQAESLVRSALEETRATSFDSLAIGTTDLPSSDPGFTMTREIFVPRNAEAHQTLGVRIRVEWPFQGRTRSLEREVWISSVRF